jgi:hypothetical protein
MSKNFEVGQARNSECNFVINFEAEHMVGLLLGKVGKSGKRSMNLNQKLQMG